jgi:hypothetical protein
VPQKELDVLQLTSRSVAEPSTGPTKLTREQRKLLEQLGASLKVDNKPADRNSTIFDKVKDIFG